MPRAGPYSRAICVASLAVAAGCTAPAYRPHPTEEIPILFRLSGRASHLRRPMRVVARDWATYCQLGLPELSVDWGREMVLVAALGPVSQPDLTVFIEGIERRGAYIYPKVRVVHSPAADVGEPEPHPLAQASSPYEVVVVPASDLNVVGFSTEPPAPRRRQARTPFALPGNR